MGAKEKAKTLYLPLPLLTKEGNEKKRLALPCHETKIFSTIQSAGVFAWVAGV